MLNDYSNGTHRDFLKGKPLDFHKLIASRIMGFCPICRRKPALIDFMSEKELIDFSENGVCGKCQRRT